jgi:small-conductance mechanosensitive channel
MEILGFDLGSIDFASMWRAFVEFTLPRLGPSLGVIALASVVYSLGRWILVRVETRLAVRTATLFDDHLVRLLRRSLQLSSVAWAVWRLVSVWSLPGAVVVVEALWLGGLAFPLSGFLGDVLEAIETRLVKRTQTTLDDTALPLLNRVVRFAVVALGLVFALDRLGLNIAPLLAGAGTMSGPHIRLRIPFTVAYEADMERAKRVLIETVAGRPGVRDDPAPVVIVRGFGPSEVNLQLRVWIEDARERRAIADAITEAVVGRFAREGIEIPYPKRQITIRTVGEKTDG